MKRLLNDAQRQAVADAVLAAEKNTRAEIVTVLAPASDDYRVYAFTAGALIALLSAAMVSISESAWAAPAWLVLLPVMTAVAAVVLGLLLQLPVFLQVVVPRKVMRRRAAALAREQFLAQNLHHTRGETGLLLFVSEFEHYVEILVDRGIAQHIPDSQWQRVVDDFTAQVRKGDVEAGFVRAIARCGDLLSAHVPPDRDNPNELPNRLVVLG